MYNEKRNDVPGLMEALWEDAGVSCEIVKSGSVSVGASVRIASEKDLSRVSHTKPPSFFVRPSKRGAVDVKEKYAELDTLRKELEAKDPEGARRLEAAYNSVGLTFFPRRRLDEGKSSHVDTFYAVLPPLLVVCGVLLLSRVR